jgi:hypothetical protein
MNMPPDPHVERDDLTVGDRVVHTRLNRRGKVTAVSPRGDVTIEFDQYYELPAFTRTFPQEEIRRGPPGMLAKWRWGPDGLPLSWHKR